METIRSAKNPLIQRVRAVRAGKLGADEGALLLEGDRLVDDAIGCGLELEHVLVAADRPERIEQLSDRGLAVRVVEPDVLARASALVKAPGCLALARRPATADVEALASGGLDLAVIAAGIQDPGNLGALARSAEAAGAGLLVILAGGCSPWNPKALRGSMGSLLRLPVAHVSDQEEAGRALERHGFRHFLAATRGGSAPEELDWTGRVALWFTAESGELRGEGALSFAPVSIPLAGSVESLNVTTAAAVLLFHIARERRSRA